MARPAKPREEKTVSFTTQLTPRAKAYLGFMADMTHQTSYAVLERAFWYYWEHLPDEDLAKDKRELVAKFADATLESEPKTKRK
jgi:hypothetical protein